MATSKAAANANNIENTKVEGTNVTSDEIVETTVEKIARLHKNMQKGRKATLKQKIEFAKELLEAKKELKNEFYTYITEEIISRKQVGRFLKLILTPEAVKNFSKGMSHKNKEADKIKANLSLLVEDKRVTSLTVEQIDTMVEPTEKTIYTAKLAKTDEDFLLAIKSDEETIKKIKPKKTQQEKDNEKKGKAETAFGKYDYQNIDFEQFQDYYDMPKDKLIELLDKTITDTSKSKLDKTNTDTSKSKLYQVGIDNKESITDDTHEEEVGA